MTLQTPVLPAAVLALSFLTLPLGYSQQMAPLPPPTEWMPPDGVPAAPGDSEIQAVKFFTQSAEVIEGAPVISEWNRVVKPDESFTMTGQRFTTFDGEKIGSDTTVWVLAVSADAIPKQASVWKVTKNFLIATLPKDIPYGVYLVWVENDKGVSTPITLNRATADWIGPMGERVSPGNRKRVFGVNLSHEHGETESHVFVRSKNGGAFVPLPVTGVEPYAVEFEVPGTMASGAYDLVVHNGHGGIYGFSNSIPLVVESPWIRARQQIKLRPSGGDDTAVLQSALEKMGDTPKGGTVLLDSGTFSVSSPLNIPPGVKLQGAGKEKTSLNSKLQRSRRFVAVYDQNAKPARWAGAFARPVSPVAKLPSPVSLSTEKISISYSYLFTTLTDKWFSRPIVTLEGSDKSGILLRVNPSGRITVRRDTHDGDFLADVQVEPLPLDSYINVRWEITGNRILALIDDEQILDAEVDFKNFGPIERVRLTGVGAEEIQFEMPVHFIADFKMSVGDSVVLADDFAGDVSPVWDEVADEMHALVVEGDHVEIGGMTLRSNQRHVSLLMHNHIRIAEMSLVDTNYGTASGRLMFHGNNVEITNSDVGFIDPLDQHLITDYWLHGNRIIGEVLPGRFNHAGVYANGRRGVIERNLFHNDWPEDRMTNSDNFMSDLRELKPMPWLARAILVGGRGSRPRAHQHYMAHNTAQGVTVQDNYGEMILLHSLSGRWLGRVTGSDGLTVRLGLEAFIDGKPHSRAEDGLRIGGDLAPHTGEQGDHIMIVEGTGFGQVRRVMDHGQDFVTIDRPWRVAPDETSVVNIAPMSVGNIIYKNRLEAFREGYEMKTHTANTGVSLYGNTFGNYVEANYSLRTRSGRAISAQSNQPSWWNEFRDEIADGLLGGSGIQVMPRREVISPALLGNTFKNIRLQDASPAVIDTATWSGVPSSRSEAAPMIAVGNIFERVEGNGPGYAILERDDGRSGMNDGMPLVENFYRYNRLTFAENSAFNLRTIKNPNGTTFRTEDDVTAVYLSNRSAPIFNGNTFPEFLGELVSVRGGGEFHPPIMPLMRAIRILPTTTTELRIVNPGLQEQQWEIRPNDPWIIVNPPFSGSIPPQGEHTLTLSMNPNIRQPGTRRGVITLRSAGQTITIGIYPQ